MLFALVVMAGSNRGRRAAVRAGEAITASSRQERSSLSSCSFVAVILPPLKETGGDQFVQQSFTEGSLQPEKAACLRQGER
jgi:hypothetical protein